MSHSLVTSLLALGALFGSTAASPRAIISLSPNVTEMLHGVGAFDRIVAVSDFCDYPPEVSRLPRVGGWLSTNLEQVASLQPDLVVMTEAQAPFVEDSLRALGIPTLVVRSDTLSEVFSAIEDIGRAVGKIEEARRLAEKTRSELVEIRAKVRERPRPRVLCVVDRLPGTLRDLYVATRTSFLSDLVEIAGGESVAPPAAASYTKLTLEALVVLDPDVIIDMVQGSPGGREETAAWAELRAVRAVRDGRVHPIRDTSVIHASQLVAKTARLFAELLHPEAFGK